ncbi:unnamed protein product [Clavelina lepadiformis]|uniref:Uncharacterized protein n=1 Tax=Clavelina lepadiformis TaxID=159417 RepID=A0ABP0H5Z3_CLALP
MSAPIDRRNERGPCRKRETTKRKRKRKNPIQAKQFPSSEYMRSGGRECVLGFNFTVFAK